MDLNRKFRKTLGYDCNIKSEIEVKDEIKYDIRSLSFVKSKDEVRDIEAFTSRNK